MQKTQITGGEVGSKWEDERRIPESENRCILPPIHPLTDLKVNKWNI